VPSPTAAAQTGQLVELPLHQYTCTNGAPFEEVWPADLAEGLTAGAIQQPPTGTSSSKNVCRRQLQPGKKVLLNKQHTLERQSLILETMVQVTGASDI
jgi:hypothetical protein